MKKILSLIMALTLVMGVNASFTPLMKKAVKNAPRLEQVQKQTAAQPATVKHAHKNFRHIDRTAIRKAPMASQTVIFAPADFADQGGEGGSSVSTTKDGITISTDKGWGHRAYNQDTQENDGAPDQFRVYTGGKLTISATSTITKIEFQVSESKYDGGLSSPYTPNATSWTETMSKQARITAITVTLGEGGTPTPPTPSGDVKITGLNYVDAIFYADETYGDYWAFDFYKELDEEGYILSPYVYFVCEESTTSGTKIAGTWTAYDAGYFATDDEESGIYTDEEVPVGSLTVTCVSQGVYNFVGSFVGTDGKTYTWTLNNMEVYAYNGDTYEDITLTDGGDGPTPVGDTTALTMLDAFEFAYYGSYSTEGAYNYSLVLYNSQDEENYVPQVGLDIYTETKDEFTGKFSAEGGNLGLDYSAFYPTADSEGESFTDASVTVTEGEGDELTVEGIFTTEAGKTYTFSVTAEPYIYDAEHPYEPQEVKTFNLTAVEGELDETYFAEYGLVYYYLYMEDGSLVGLTYRTANGTQPKGTFAISDEEGADAFLTGMDYYGYADGSYYETVEGDVYYFVSGSVTLATDELGNTTITANATSCYGSTFTVTGVIGGKQPSGDHTIVIADYKDVNFTTLDGAYTVASAANGGTAPAYNENGEDLRLYAKNIFTLTKNTKDGPMTKVVFNISTKGLTRQAEIAVSTGKIVEYDMDAATVTWEGEASEIVFTVGEKNVYGSDGKTKAGQFDFTSMDIEGSDYSALDNINTGVKAVKFFDGKQVIIERNGRQYNLLGF
ncbi:MAG: hypothetical protein MJZ84_03375 [Paludibacteraceae bacterium]|nr:hypothetical protein [Paludibacteraceae bacterium]